MQKLFYALLGVFCAFALVAQNVYVADFAKNQDGWNTQSYWGGKLTYQPQEKILHIVPTFSRNKDWARIFRSFRREFAGKVLHAEVEVCGKGRASLRGILYGEDFSRPGIVYLNVSGKEIAMNGAWQKLQCDFDFRDIRSMSDFGVLIDLNGNRESTLDIRAIRIQEVENPEKIAEIKLTPDNPALDGHNCLFFDQFGFLDELGEDHEDWKMHHGKWGECNGTLAAVATNDKKGACARVSKLVTQDGDHAGHHYTFSGRFRGKGKLKLGCLIGIPDVTGDKKYSFMWSKETTLNNKWQKLVWNFDLSKCAPEDLFLMVESGGADSHFEADNTMLVRRWQKGVTIAPENEMAILRAGKLDKDLHFTLTGGGLDTTVIPGANPVPFLGKKVSASNGTVTVPAAEAGVRGKAYVADSGTAAYTMLLNLAAEEYDAFDALAKKFHPAKPLNVMVFGDSLLDKNFSLNKEYASMKQLNVWLNKYHPGMVTLDNRAVRGDTVRSVWERMEGKNSFEAQVYRNLFQAKADVIFIMLGHNDVRADNAPDFTKPLLAPEEQLQYFRLVLGKLKATWPNARIVIVTPTTGNYKLTSEKIAKTLQNNPKAEAVLFAKPALLESYIENLKLLAKEFGTEYYDIYSAMKALPQEEKQRLFSPRDGVHLSLEGQKYVAKVFLQYLAEHP